MIKFLAIVINSEPDYRFNSLKKLKDLAASENLININIVKIRKLASFIELGLMVLGFSASIGVFLVKIL